MCFLYAKGPRRLFKKHTCGRGESLHFEGEDGADIAQIMEHFNWNIGCCSHSLCRPEQSVQQHGQPVSASWCLSNGGASAGTTGQGWPGDRDTGPSSAPLLRLLCRELLGHSNSGVETPSPHLQATYGN